MSEGYGSAALLEGLRRVAASPLEEAFTIPPAIYGSEEIHRLELERIFAKDWLCPGLAADIPEAGDYITYSIIDQPFFTIRGKDGCIRSFANVCLHRMMILLEGRRGLQRGVASARSRCQSDSTPRRFAHSSR